MEGIVRGVSEHPLIAMAVGFAVLLIVYFLFKSLIKIALILILIAVAIGGYFYFQHPESRPTSIEDAVHKARTGAAKAVEQGKQTYEMGKELVEKGEKAYEKGKELVDKGEKTLEKGKELVEKGIDRGKEATAVLLGEEKPAGPPKKP
jgi:hypothetical protein